MKRWLAAVLLFAAPLHAADEALCLVRNGPELYAEWCARCHGDAGDGKGPAGVALAFNGRPPRDFTKGHFRFKSTPSGAAASDDDLRRTILHGLPGTAMPYFSDLIAPEDVGKLVQVIRGFAEEAPPAAQPIDLGEEPSDGPESHARGAELYDDLGCAVCHGKEADGRGRSVADLRNDDGSRARPVDLRRPWTFRGGSAARDVAMRLATGLAGTPMPSYLDAASLTDLWHVAHWIESIAVAPTLRDAAVAAAKAPPDEKSSPVERGEYLAKSGTCFLCHVQMEEDGRYREGSFAAGGMRVEIPAFATVWTRNLTPDAETGLGGWTSDDFRRALREGRSRDGRPLGALDMPWTILRNLDDHDLDALHAYFASLEPVRNAVPSPRAPPAVDGIVRKAMLVWRGEQAKAGFFPGNGGSAEGAATAAVEPRENLAAAAVLAVLVLLVWISLFRRRWLNLIASALLAVLAWTYLWPPLELLPSSLVAGHVNWGPLVAAFNLPPLRPPPEPVAMDDADLRALAERGRAVATLGTCSLCHTAGPSLTRLYAPFPEMGGGMRVNWKVFGTTFSRNLTPDEETGLGGWSDAEIRRAFTAGLARDGRTMHWQAMPWDHFSNLSLEDQEALVFYLRSLAPIWSKVPEPLPPAPSDEPADTFFFGYSGELRSSSPEP